MVTPNKHYSPYYQCYIVIFFDSMVTLVCHNVAFSHFLVQKSINKMKYKKCKKENRHKDKLIKKIGHQVFLKLMDNASCYCISYSVKVNMMLVINSFYIILKLNIMLVRTRSKNDI